jgi:small subunit ribosomal protein S17
MAIIDGKSIRELTGKVISAKGTKTLTVAVDRVKMHALYKKRYTTTKKYYVHDEKEQAKEGDVVRIRETRPMSKTKRWLFIEVIQAAQIAA